MKTKLTILAGLHCIENGYKPIRSGLEKTVGKEFDFFFIPFDKNTEKYDREIIEKCLINLAKHIQKHKDKFKELFLIYVDHPECNILEQQFFPFVKMHCVNNKEKDYNNKVIELVGKPSEFRPKSLKCLPKKTPTSYCLF